MNPSISPINPNKALWEKGDFTKIAAYMCESGAAFVNSVGVTMPLTFRSPDQCPEQVMRMFNDFYGPTMNAFDAEQKNGKADELRAHVINHDGGTTVAATFLRATVSL